MRRHCQTCICQLELVKRKQWREDMEVPTLQDAMDNHIMYAMLKTDGVQTQAAKILGINRNTLKKHIDRIIKEKKDNGLLSSM